MNDHVFTVFSTGSRLRFLRPRSMKFAISWVANGLRRRQAFVAIPCAG